jgi:hypothetical protein
MYLPADKALCEAGSLARWTVDTLPVSASIRLGTEQSPRTRYTQRIYAYYRNIPLIHN